MSSFLSDQTPLFFAFALLIGGALYMVPTIVAICRTHRSTGQIAVLNLFLGLTFFGWVGALMWALSSRRGVPGALVVRP